MVDWNQFLQFFIHPWKPVRWNAKIFLMHAEVEEILAVLILRSWAIAYVMDMVNGDSSSLNFLNQQGLEGKDRQRIMLQSVRYYSWWYGLENPIFFVIDYKWMNCALLACPMERLNGVLHHGRIIFRTEMHKAVNAFVLFFSTALCMHKDCTVVLYLVLGLYTTFFC